MKLVHYYHVYGSGAWQEPLRDHLNALEESGLLESLDDYLRVGVVGTAAEQRAVLRFFAGRNDPNNLPFQVDVVGTAEEGFEQITLAALERDCQREDAYYLYAHTKGASAPSRLNTAWRRGMTEGVVGRWSRCVALLDEGYDAVGSHWQGVRGDVSSPYFAGTFWWASTSYLRTLPPLEYGHRMDAEAYIGRATVGEGESPFAGWVTWRAGNPRVYDLRPTHPSIWEQVVGSS